MNNIHNLIRADASFDDVKKLINNQPNLRNDRDNKGRYAVHIAIKQNRSDLIELLMPRITVQNQDTYNAYNSKDNKGYTPLFKAIKKGNIVCFNKLIKCFADPEHALLNQGMLPLHGAIEKNQPKMLKHLLVNYPNASRQLFTKCSVHNKNPISFAASINAFGAIRHLLDNGDDINHITDPIFRQNYQALITEYPRNQYLFPPKALVFEGGGAKGIIFSGATTALEEENMLADVERVGGTSVGGITATLLAFGYSAAEINEISKKPGKDFIPPSEFTLIQNGLFSGEALEQWLDKCIEKKTGIKHCTFGELAKMIEDGHPFRHLHVYARQRSTHDTVEFNSEVKDLDDPMKLKWENLIISSAGRASASLPVVYYPHYIIFKLKNGTYATEENKYTNASFEKLCTIKNTKNVPFADGGSTYNFPIDAFDFKGYFVKNNPKGLFNVHDDNPYVLGLKFDNTPNLGYDSKARNLESHWKSEKIKPETHRKFIVIDHIKIDRIIRINDCGINSISDICNITPIRGKGQQGIKAGYLTTKQFFRRRLREIEPLQLANKAKIVDHEFLLVKSSVEFSKMYAKEQFEDLKNYNNEFELFKLIEDKAPEDVIEPFYEQNKDFFENEYVKNQLIQYISLQDNVDFLVYFHKKNILSNVTFNDGSSFMHMLLRNGCYKAFEYFIDTIDTIDLAVPENGKTLLHNLVESQNTRLIEKFIQKAKDKGALTKIIEKENELTHSIIFKTDDPAIWRILIENKIDITKRDPNTDRTLLYLLVRNNYPITTELFCEELKRYPADIQTSILDAIIISGQDDLRPRYWGQKIRKTAIIRAFEADYAEIVMLLIKSGANYSTDVDGYDPLSYLEGGSETDVAMFGKREKHYC